MDSYYVKNGVRVKANSNIKIKEKTIEDRARKKEEDLRVEKVVVHVSKNEKELIKELSKQNGMDMSSFIRCLCLYQYNKIVGGIVK